MHYRHITNLKSYPEEFLLEFIIWMTDFQHKKIISSKHLYIDGTFHVPKNFYQLIIILYYGELTNKRYPGVFILINSKTEIAYQICLSQFSEILSSYGEYELNFETITTDFESANFDIVIKIFYKAKIIGCYYHFKAVLYRKAWELGFMKKSEKIETKILISRLG